MSHFIQNPNRFIGFLFIALIVLGACSSSSRSKKPVIDDSGLPPDPGESGTETIAGVDSDSDGVRDDIQRFIALTYPDQPEVQKALSQNAKATQDLLLDVDDPEKTVENFKQVTKASACLFFRDPEKAYEISRKLDAEYFNTKDRILAYDRAGSHLSGHVFPSAKDKAKSCDDYEEAQ